MITMPILYHLTPEEQDEVDSLSIFIGDEANSIVGDITMQAARSRLRSILDNAISRYRSEATPATAPASSGDDCVCLRCGHNWERHVAKPLHCALCNSAKWNVPKELHRS